MKTIKQVADEIGVSKTAVRNYMDDAFRAKYTAKDDKGVITITPEGCKVLSENIGKQTENTAKQFPETELLTIPKFIYEDLLAQLATKDQQISDLTAAVKSQAQSINADRHNELAGTMQQLLPDASSDAQFEPVEAFAGEEVQKPAQEPSDAQSGLQEVVRGLSWGEIIKAKFGRKKDKE